MSSSYLQGDFRTDREQVAAAHQLIDDLVCVFLRFFDANTKEWPYSVSAHIEGDTGDSDDGDKRYSFSTNAMIMYSLVTAVNEVTQSTLLPTRVARSGVGTPSESSD